MRDLTAWPPMLRKLLESVPHEKLTQRSAAGGFALVEHVWHLADLEVEGYGVRLRSAPNDPIGTHTSPGGATGAAGRAG